ncbi:discoidin domain-containing protein [Kitasatospora sp. YST-16]|uniref:discoidin domain-containing protein n=1 Tax=Kitasatospora sp. YST-16 TaxID=2998080 RepID=UPI0022835520|nr:discoidin domain-containing protein [Kitasatospora sp. YST-16]WAL73016.1 discoidin domain-containing protein [Kitasatospora sp. YST-16]WNW39067.1 discoidin domain-containing protein [Streptomyces sp. Li-HN-5-13]
MSRRLLKSSVFLIASALFAGLAQVPAFAATPSVWIQSASDHIFSSSGRPSAPVTGIALYAARNEIQAAQIAVRSTSDATGVSVVAGDLTGPGGASIPAADITVSSEYNHPNVNKPGAQTQNPPDGSSNYYDALIENTPSALAANYTQPYYYSVAVPTGQAPGTYSGTATVQSSLGNVSVPVTVTVYDVTVPPANRSTFRMNNWFTSAGWDYAGTELAIPLQYGVTMYDANWWKVIGNIAADHAKHRNNVIWADFQALLIPNSSEDANGNYTFGWATYDRFIQTFIDAGALQYIYQTPLIGGTYGSPQLHELQNVNGVLSHVRAPANTAAATTYLNTVFSALKAHLDSKCLDSTPVCAPGRRWSDVLYMSSVDEPTNIDTAQMAASNWLYDRYHAYFPGGMTNEAQYNIAPSDHQRLSTLTPVGNDTDFDANYGYYQSQRLAGKDLWLYDADHPLDNHLNRFISYPLAESRLIPLMESSVGAIGYLHWGWNYWVDPLDWNDYSKGFVTLDTFNYSNQVTASASSGNYMLVRPNKATYGIYDSVRSEAQLYGLQDYELLHQLSAVKPVTARALLNTLITNTTTYDTSGADIDQRHKQILDALVAPGGDASFPFTDDFSSGNDANWRHLNGSWSVTPGPAYVQSSTDTASWNVVSAVAGRAYQDAAASVDLQITGVNTADGGNSNWAGLTVHSLNPTDTDSGYLVAVRDNGGLFVYRSGTQLASTTVPGYTAGQLVHLRVVTRGSTIQVYANGTTPLLTVTDGSFPVGSIGLATGGASAKFANVRINPLVNPVEAAAVTVSSSYEADGWSAGAAVDGGTGSSSTSVGWSSALNSTAAHTEWITADLGAAKPLSRIDLFPRSDGANTGMGFPVDFTVQVSADGTNWTTVASVTGAPRPGAGAQSFPFATADVRYIKVTGTKLSTDQLGHYYMQLAEIQAAGGDLALGRPVSASSSVDDYGAGWVRPALTDGSVASDLGYSMGWSSRASTATGPEWATVDLGGVSPVSRVDLTARTDGANTGLGFPVDFTVQVSPDNVNWTTVVTRTGYPRPTTAVQSFTFPPVTARYVKVSGTKLSADQFGTYYLQLGEMSVRS